MILTPAMAAMALQILPSIGSLVGAGIGGKKGKKIATQSATLGKILGSVAGLSKAFASPSTGTPTDPSPIPDPTPNPTPGTDPGLTIGGGLLGNYNSPIPGLLGIGKGDSIFDPKFNVNQLGIHPYNNTPATLAEWLK